MVNGLDTPSDEMLEVQNFLHSNSTILENLGEVNGHPYNQQLDKKLKTIGLKSYPMYVLVNKSGIVYTSPHLSEVKSFVKSYLGGIINVKP